MPCSPAALALKLCRRCSEGGPPPSPLVTHSVGGSAALRRSDRVQGSVESGLTFNLHLTPHTHDLAISLLRRTVTAGGTADAHDHLDRGTQRRLVLYCTIHAQACQARMQTHLNLLSATLRRVSALKPPGTSHGSSDPCRLLPAGRNPCLDPG